MASKFIYTRIPSPYEGDHESLWITGYRVERDGETIGFVMSHRHASSTTYARIRRDLGNPVVWEAYRPLHHPAFEDQIPMHDASLRVGYHYYSRKDAAEALDRKGK